MSSLYDFTVRSIDGEPVSLRDFEGRVLLIVNVASRCGSTPQYAGLEALHRRHQDRGFSVLGFPCNQFGKQEPGTEAQIKEFCTTHFDVTFPLFEKLDVKGPAQDALFGFLTSRPSEPDGPGEIRWNFAKFLIDRRGEVAARFPTSTEPDSEALVSRIEQSLGTASR